MFTNLLKPFVVVFLAMAGFACTDTLDLDSTEQAIDPPSTVTATALSDTRIEVSWSSVVDARKYYIFQSTSGGPFNFAGTVLAPGTSRIVVNLTPSTTYSFRIVTVHLDGSESLPSATASATTLGAGGGTTVTATTVSNTSIQVSWSAVANAKKYYLYQALGMTGTFNFAGTILVPGTSRLVQSLMPNTQYCYRIVTEFVGGSQSTPSAIACATTQPNPGAPTGLTATAISDTRINLQWSPVTGATKYFVYESQAGGGAPFAFRASVLAPTTAYLAANLAPSTTYCFRISSVASNNVESSLSNTVCATTFAVGGGGYQGFWKFDERTGSTALDSSGFFRHGALAGGATYSIAEKPQVDDNRSALSITSATSSVVTMPAGNGLNLVGNFSVAFWANVPAAGTFRFLGMRQAGCGAVAYEIGQDANGLYFQGETQLVSFGTSLAANTWTHVAVTHASGTMRTYVNGTEVSSGAYTATNTTPGQLQVGHVAGCASDAFLIDHLEIYNRQLSAGEVGVLGVLPPAPTNLVVASKTSRSMLLSWDPVADASSYIISRGTASGNQTFYTHSPADPSTFQADHLDPNTQYSWTVRAVVNGLFGPPSNEVIDTTNPPPAAPTNVAAMALTSSRINVTWTAVPNATKYYVFQSQAGGPFVFRGSVVAPGTSFLAVNLQPGTLYSYQVQAEDAAQTTGPMSASASATTPAM